MQSTKLAQFTKMELPSAATGFVPFEMAQIMPKEFVPTELAQIPSVLFLQVGVIINSSWTAAKQMKRDFSIYSKKELLGYKQLERAIKTDAMASFLRAKDIQSEALHTTYAKSPALFKDTAYICSAIFGRFKSLLRSFSAIFGHTCGRSCSHCGRSRLFSVVLYRWFLR